MWREKPRLRSCGSLSSTLTDAGVHLGKVRAMDDELPHPLRSDAQDNRRRILQSARTLFAVEGADVPMREIARHAGVGPATLYRRFPTKQELIAETFAEEVRACHDIVDAGLAASDPWLGFCTVIERICDLHARNRGFTEAFLSALPDTTAFVPAREHTLTAIVKLAHRAQRIGKLRPDFVVDDLVLMLMANRGIQAASVDRQVAASRRFAAFAIQAFQAGQGRTPLPPAARLTPLAPLTPLTPQNHA